MLSSLLLLNITQSIEKELLERIKKGVYQQADIYNYPIEAYNKVIDMEELNEVDEEDEEVHIYQSISAVNCVLIKVGRNLSSQCVGTV